MAASGEKILHQSLLDLDKKRVSVSLTPKHIAVEHGSKEKAGDNGQLDVKLKTTPCEVIPLEEVIAIQPHAPHQGKDRFRVSKGGVYEAVEMQAVHPIAFDVYLIKRTSKHRWRHKVLTFTCKDSAACIVWIDKVKDVLYAAGCRRPQHLLVFVNPYGGKKRAPKIFEKVHYFFDLAGVRLDVIETQRQYHAQEVVKTYDLSSIDGIVCVGGDGTFSEILNGLLNRCNADGGIDQTFRHQPVRPSLRIGIIPAGSTDCVVYTTIGTNDPVTSTLQIIIGDSVGVDVNALYKQEQFVKYSVTMTSYGYYGDLLADSERFRWMGPKRYSFSGFKKFCMNRSYEGEVSFLPAEEGSGHPQDGNRCVAGCEVCQWAGREAEMAYKADTPSFDLGGGEIMNVPKSDGWQKVSGKFQAINAVTVSCRCAMSPLGMSPNTHLGDGCMDLILVFDCTRVDYLRHLTRIPRREADQFDFSYVAVHRVREFQFHPCHDPEEDEDVLTLESSEASSDGASRGSRSSSSQKSLKHSQSQNSVWNCDGELVEHPNLHIQVHCQLIRLFARGVEDVVVKEPETCPVCFNTCTRY